MASEFDTRDPNADRQLHEQMAQSVARSTARRDQIESHYRDSKGREKEKWGELLQDVETSLQHFKRAHDRFTDELVERGVLPDSARQQPTANQAQPTTSQRVPPAGDAPGAPSAPTKPSPDAPAQPGRKKTLPIGARGALSEATAGDLDRGHKDEGMIGAAKRGFVHGIFQGLRAKAERTTEAGASMSVPEDEQQPERPHAGNRGPVRNAEGLTLQDLAAAAPEEDPLPGTIQPFALDVIDEVQGTRPSRSVAMNPDHTAALRALETGRDNGLEGEEDRFGR